MLPGKQLLGHLQAQQRGLENCTDREEEIENFRPYIVSCVLLITKACIALLENSIRRGAW